MNERDKLIAKLMKEKKGSREDYLSLINSISYHESAGTLDPTIKQIGGGPGRGKYQFEIGKNAGGITAAKRTKTYYKEQGIPVPEWLDKSSKGDTLDASTLSSEQQDILFLGNMRKHPKANFTNVWEGKQSVTDFWADYHWAGKSEDRRDRVKSFNNSLNKFKTIVLPQEDNKNLTKKEIKDVYKYIEELNKKIPKFDINKDLNFIEKNVAKLLVGKEDLNKMQSTYNKLAEFKNNRKNNKISKEEIKLRTKIANAQVFSYPKSLKDLRDFNNRVEKGEDQAPLLLGNHGINIRKALNNKYFEIPYDTNVISKSKHKPTISKNKDSEYFSFNKELLQPDMDNFKSLFNNFDNFHNKVKDHKGGNGEKGNPGNLPFYKFHTPKGVLGQLKNYKMSAGEDEKGKYISYYDKWDIDPPLLKKRGINIDKLNSPYEIYGRVYEKDFNNNETESNKKALGGNISGNNIDNSLNSYNTGGLHETNPNGGIPQGIGANGKPNTVEEGETSFDLKDGKYIFSNRLGFGGKIKNYKSTNNSYPDGGKLKTNPIIDPPTDKKPTPMFNPTSFMIPGTKPKTEKLQFTKNDWQPTTGGGMKKVSSTTEIPNIREQFMYPNMISTQKQDTVNFDLAIQDESSKTFLNRYNNEWSRKKLQEQAGLSNENIDNMILRGLNAKKEIGGNAPNSKASFDRDKNLVSMGEEHAHDEGVETHERVHSSNFDAAQGKTLMNVLGNPFQQEGRSFMKKSSPETVRYLKKPHEAYGNFVEFREKLGLKPGEQIDEIKLKELIKKKGLGNENFYRVYNDKNIIEALNTVASNNTRQTNNTKLA